MRSRKTNESQEDYLESIFLITQKKKILPQYGCCERA